MVMIDVHSGLSVVEIMNVITILVNRRAIETLLICVQRFVPMLQIFLNEYKLFLTQEISHELMHNFL